MEDWKNTRSDVHGNPKFSSAASKQISPRRTLQIMISKHSHAGAADSRIGSPPDWVRRALAGLSLALACVWGGSESLAAIIEYSTYLGGAKHDGAHAVAVDGSGNVLVAGSASSTNFPIRNGFQTAYGGGDSDAFLARFDSEGRLVFSTFLGGLGVEAVHAIAIDPDGNVILAGETRSVDLPSTGDAFQYDYAGGSAFGPGDAFIAKFSPDGSELLYCSYFGGRGDETIMGAAFDSKGNLWITGLTGSQDFPLEEPLQPALGSVEGDAFVAQFDPSLRTLLFSTYLGGNQRDVAFQIVAGPDDCIYICGSTFSTNFPVTPGAFQTEHLMDPQLGDNLDAFVAKLAPDGSSLIYATYFGQERFDLAFALAVDAEGSVYITGSIAANWDVDTFPFGFQPVPGYGSSDAYVAKFTPDGSAVAWFSYLGGSGNDQGLGLVLDRENHVCVTGITGSRDFPIRDAPQRKFGGGDLDAFVARISADGQQLLYSTYLGGSNDERGANLVADTSGNIVVVGDTSSLNFPTRGAFQPANGSTRTIPPPTDAFIARISPQVERPRLNIARSGGSLVLHWSTEFSGFTLESSPGVGPAPDWTPFPFAPLVLGNQFTVIASAASPAKCFRLKRE
jgi:hypothetical protein